MSFVAMTSMPLNKLLPQSKNKKPNMNPSDDSTVGRTRARPQPQPTISIIDRGVFDDYPAQPPGPKASSKKHTHALETSQVYNIVVFGDSGVGKSSLINMLAGQETAATSDGVLGCTFQSHRYQFTIGEERVNIWDTAGFDEGTRGRVSPEVAEKNLVKLLQDLRGANGVHLLVYCIRGPSVRKSLARNYVIFHSAICRKKVPIVAVVTGLENEPDSMDNWWTRGEKELAKYKMRFDAHACVTTMNMNKFVGSVFEERSRSSQEVVRRLIIDQCHGPAIRPPIDSNIFIKAALRDFRSMMKSGWENIGSSGSGPAASVFFSQNDIPLIHPGFFGNPRQIHSQINGRSFVFYHADDPSGRYINQKLPKSGADLLIFAGRLTEYNLQKFQGFYKSCSGEVCPLLIITDSRECVQWTNYLNGCGISAHVEPFAKVSQIPANLSDLIDELCLVRGATQSGKEKILRYLRRGSKENAADT